MPHPSQNEHPSKKGSAEVISPLSIQGPSRGQDRLRPERHRLRNVLLLGLVLIAIVALGSLSSGIALRAGITLCSLCTVIALRSLWANQAGW